MILDDWALTWNVSTAALEDLRKRLGLRYTSIIKGERSEAGVQSEVRLEAAQKGVYLWRNNVGALHTQTGEFVRYGLANDSKNVNRVIKSADLIGIRPVKITEAMIGWTVGQFISREVKAENWRYSGSDREQAQLRWAELILSLGGDACFTNGKGTL